MRISIIKPRTNIKKKKKSACKEFMEFRKDRNRHINNRGGCEQI